MSDWPVLKEKLLQPVSGVETVRARNALKNQGIAFVGQLYLIHGGILLRGPNMGHQSLGKINDFLAGLELTGVPREADHLGEPVPVFSVGPELVMDSSESGRQKYREAFADFLEENQSFFEKRVSLQAIDNDDPLEGLSQEFVDAVMSAPKVRRVIRETVQSLRPAFK